MVSCLVFDGRRSFLVPPGLSRPSSIPNPPRTKFFVCHTSAYSRKNARSEQASQQEGLTLSTFVPSSCKLPVVRSHRQRRAITSCKSFICHTSGKRAHKSFSCHTFSKKYVAPLLVQAPGNRRPIPLQCDNPHSSLHYLYATLAHNLRAPLLRR